MTEPNYFAELLSVLSSPELRAFQDRLDARHCHRTAQVLHDEIIERGLPARYPKLPAFQCPDCGRISYNLKDIEEQWCNHCKRGPIEREFYHLRDALADREERPKK